MKLLDYRAPGRVQARREHWHLVLSTDHEEDRVITTRAYADEDVLHARLYEIGLRNGEDRTEWYEDGSIAVEGTWPGKTGIRRIWLDKLECRRAACLPRGRDN